MQDMETSGIPVRKAQATADVPKQQTTMHHHTSAWRTDGVGQRMDAFGRPTIHSIHAHGTYSLPVSNLDTRDNSRG